MTTASKSKVLSRMFQVIFDAFLSPPVASKAIYRANRQRYDVITLPINVIKCSIWNGVTLKFKVHLN